MPLRLRTPTPDDADTIAALHVESWRETYSALLPPNFFSEDYRLGRVRLWNRILNDAEMAWRVRVAEEDGDMAGFAMAGPAFGSPDDDLPRTHQLYSLYVLQRSHGTGAGQQLLDAALGDSPALLWVAQRNPRAIAFYRRNGFAFDGAEQTDPAAPGLVAARMLR